MNTSEVNKVAEVTALFWVMKIVATTLGETLGDFIAQTLGLGYTFGMVITVMFFIVVLLLQLNVKRYVPSCFWIVIIATTTLGTEISDFMDRTLGLGYTVGSVILFSCLSITLVIWYKRFKNLSISPIYQKKKELLFWVAVLFSNSLGTAFGDYLTDEIGLTYVIGALVTGAIIGIVLLLHYYSKINEVFLFWVAFVFTRPFGATFGDFLTKPLAKGGLDLGTWQATLVSVILISGLIIYSHRNINKTKA
ncbi:hypothetical protein [Formosa sp. PL04]|uniref:COG4705 family protein n=1 Tax=Formosa sp. PL04 TaxID=3081755 RepID=UPI00298181AC|nr:hypothetical protein [Formosa sp. PL04]MDW5290335.1 hypothetical protein [Formosa sp. PL04]